MDYTDLPDRATEQLCRLARQAKLHVVMGINERNAHASGASLYNSLLYIDHNGEIAGIHRKLVPSSGERLVWMGGDGATMDTYNVPFGKLGGLICWENYMPLARYAMYSLGVQVYVAPTWDRGDLWLATLRHIAREGGVFVIGCCMALHINHIPERLEFRSYYPQDTTWINHGDSCIVNPRGEIIAGPVKENEDILYAEIDIQQVHHAKRMLDVAGHYARPDVFQLSLNRHPHTLIQDFSTDPE